MSKPTHIAYVVIPANKGSDKKPIWREAPCSAFIC